MGEKFGALAAVTLYYRTTCSETLTCGEAAGCMTCMHHEFTYVGSNAVLSSHVCDVCGLVVAIASSEPAGALPLDGCCVRNDVVPTHVAARAVASRSASSQMRAVVVPA
jgi:hypothetical protein